ncbi:hypothetical protein MMC14_007544 [Varicellaria rhodocarpa]|nr:hypothetical protein [Varicellaria rhodocarpa]
MTTTSPPSPAPDPSSATHTVASTSSLENQTKKLNLTTPHSTSGSTHTIASTTSSEYKTQRFGPLLDITEESIIPLALKVRNQVSSAQLNPSAKHQLISRLNRECNLVFIVKFEDGVKYVVRIPGTGWGDRFTDSARKSFDS